LVAIREKEDLTRNLSGGSAKEIQRSDGCFKSTDKIRLICCTERSNYVGGHTEGRGTGTQVSFEKWWVTPALGQGWNKKAFVRSRDAQLEVSDKNRFQFSAHLSYARKWKKVG